MNNGIGLPTPRGSGTSGYVVRNLSHINASTLEKRNSQGWNKKSFQADKNVHSPKIRTINQDILKHNQKRKVEIQVLEYQSKLEDENEISKLFSEEEILQKVEDYRLELLLCYERHVIESEKRMEREADIKEQENARLKKALGISSPKRKESFNNSPKRSKNQKSSDSEHKNSSDSSLSSLSDSE